MKSIKLNYLVALFFAAFIFTSCTNNAINAKTKTAVAVNEFFEEEQYEDEDDEYDDGDDEWDDLDTTGIDFDYQEEIATDTTSF